MATRTTNAVSADLWRGERYGAVNITTCHYLVPLSLAMYFSSIWFIHTQHVSSAYDTKCQNILNKIVMKRGHLLSPTLKGIISRRKNECCCKVCTHCSCTFLEAYFAISGIYLLLGTNSISLPSITVSGNPLKHIALSLVFKMFKWKKNSSWRDTKSSVTRQHPSISPHCNRP